LTKAVQIEEELTEIEHRVLLDLGIEVILFLVETWNVAPSVE
jgi:hypothetical protein